MNLAQPAFVIFILLLPGYVLVYGYRAPEFEGGNTFVDDLAKATIGALVIHLGLYLICENSPAFPAVDRKAVLAFMAGEVFTSDGSLNPLLEHTVEERYRFVFGYLAFSLFSGAVVGRLWRGIVDWLRLDLHLPFIRFSRWRYLFEANPKPLDFNLDNTNEVGYRPATIATVACQIADDKVFFYIGVPKSWDINSKRSLVRVGLQEPLVCTNRDHVPSDPEELIMVWLGRRFFVGPKDSEEEPDTPKSTPDSKKQAEDPTQLSKSTRTAIAEKAIAFTGCDLLYLESHQIQNISFIFFETKKEKGKNGDEVEYTVNHTPVTNPRKGRRRAEI